MWHADSHIFKAIEAASTLAASTKKCYASYLRKALSVTGERSISEVLAFPKEAIPKLQSAIHNRDTLRNTVTALIAAMQNTSMGRDHPSELAAWKEQLAVDVQHLSSQRESGQGTHKQQAAFVPWTQAQDVLRKLGERAPGSSDHILLGMFVAIPPRRPGDYYRVRLVAEDPADPADSPAWLNTSTGRLRVNVYKTVRTYGPFVTTLPKVLLDSVRASVRRQPREYLFVQRNKKPFASANSFDHFCVRALRRLFHDSMSVNVLRHAMCTHIATQNLSLADWKRVAEQMGHSVETNLSYSFHKSPVAGMRKALKTT